MAKIRVRERYWMQYTHAIARASVEQPESKVMWVTDEANACVLAKFLQAKGISVDEFKAFAAGLVKRYGTEEKLLEAFDDKPS